MPNILDETKPAIKRIIMRNNFFPTAPIIVKKHCRANGEGSIRKKGNGYEGRITVGFDENGKQLRKSVYASTRKECHDRMLELRIAYKEKSLPVIEEAEPVFIDWINTWLAEYKHDISSATKVRYNILLNQIKNSKIAETPLSKLRPIELQQFANTVPSYDLARRMVGLIKGAIAAAVDNGYLQRNIAFSLRNNVPVNQPRFSEEDKALNKNEEARFLEAIADNPYRILYYLCLFAGLRRGEACAMTWDSIDLEKRVLHIKEAATLNKYGTDFEVGKTKTVSSVRKVPISQKLMDELEATPRIGKYVCERDGKMLRPNRLTMDCGNVMKRLGMKHTLHQLRHTFATRCYEKGIDIKAVQAWMGHITADMTLNTYTHATADQLKAAAKKLD